MKTTQSVLGFIKKKQLAALLGVSPRAVASMPRPQDTLATLDTSALRSEEEGVSTTSKNSFDEFEKIGSALLGVGKGVQGVQGIHLLWK